jgi:hypothetical protein
MIRNDQERWQELCEAAAVVEDPRKFARIAKHIRRLLDTEQKRLDANTPSKQTQVPARES